MSKGIDTKSYIKYMKLKICCKESFKLLCKIMLMHVRL